MLHAVFLSLKIVPLHVACFLKYIEYQEPNIDLDIWNLIKLKKKSNQLICLFIFFMANLKHLHKLHAWRKHLHKLHVWRQWNWEISEKKI
jgi:hypothetical protein